MNRSEVLLRLTDAVVEGTLADTSLRNLAAAAGTSARMLIYHFGSREELMIAVSDEIASRWKAVVSESAMESDGLNPSVELSRMWHSISARRNERLIRALMQIHGLAISGTDGLDEVRAQAISILRDAAEHTLDRSGLEPRRRREATSLLAFAMWGAAEQIVISRDRVMPNEAILGLIERLEFEKQ